MKLLPLLLLVMSASTLYAQLPPIGPGVSHDLAIWRAAHYSDVRYKLNLTLEKMSPVLKGTIEIRVNLTAIEETESLPKFIILDWRKIVGHEKDSTISNVSLNGTGVTLKSDQTLPVHASGLGKNPRDYYEISEHLIFAEGVHYGENVIKLDFTSPILTSGSAITRYIDKEDGSEYLYSLFVPSDASTAFPVFDQPDLKARFTLVVDAPNGWKVISNTQGLISATKTLNEWGFNFSGEGHIFEGTQPISTYVFAFAAGPWQEFSSYTKWINKDVVYLVSTGGIPSGSEGVSVSAPKNTLPTGRVSASAADGPLSSHIYVRKSQAAKFQPHAAETFRLMREGIKYLESYFDYKFPWPKYDIVLIPEFPFGGMEHAGATFVRESSIIFPTEPTKSDYINRATLIFHETAHQWFGDMVTMKWFDDLWLKEGFAQFMAYKAMEKIMPEMNAWKVFYERIKQPAYATDSTKGTTPIYQPIENLSAAKSAYGNIVYNKAPAFLRQAEFYIGEDKFQTAVRSFLKKHEYANAGWEDLVGEFESVRPPGAAKSIVGDHADDMASWAKQWVTVPGAPIVKTTGLGGGNGCYGYNFVQNTVNGEPGYWREKFPTLIRFANEKDVVHKRFLLLEKGAGTGPCDEFRDPHPIFLMPNYGDYGYGIFLLDDKSREYVLKNIQNEKDAFLRSMMWGALWDSVREAEFDPRQYVELAIKNLPTETDETITASVLGRVSTAMTYYIPADAPDMQKPARKQGRSAKVDDIALPNVRTSAPQTDGMDLQSRLEAVLIDRMRNAPTLGQRITYYRAFLNSVSTENGRNILKAMLKSTGGNPSGGEGVIQRPQDAMPASSRRSDAIPLKTKDRFDIVTRLAILGDSEAPKLLADLEKTETSDDAKRYAYAAHAAFATKENREKFWNDFVNNKDISESWIEAATRPFNSPKHSDLSLPYLQKALAELPNLKRNRKIFFVNGWLGAFIGGQKSQEALNIVNKFLADNPNLDRDLKLKILENVDIIERAVKIRNKYSKI